MDNMRLHKLKMGNEGEETIIYRLEGDEMDGQN